MYSIWVILGLLSAKIASGKHIACGITPRDGLVIVDFQNDFMQAQPVRQGVSPNYDITDYLDSTGRSIKPGSLAVNGTADIVTPINRWIESFNANGARIFASLDWHDSNHCSFCRNGTMYPHGAVCGPLPQAGFNATGRCNDSVAIADYGRGSLMQWPDHCVQDRFGSRFQPYLKLPKNTTVVKKGWDVDLDNYSAFGGTLSVQQYPFDTKDDKSVLENRPSLSDMVVKYDIRRLWVLGIALDFCVGNTVLDALGKNEDTKRPKPETLEATYLVLPCTRSVGNSTGDEMIQRIQKAGGKIITKVDPYEGVTEGCDVTHPHVTQDHQSSNNDTQVPRFILVPSDKSASRSINITVLPNAGGAGRNGTLAVVSGASSLFQTLPPLPGCGLGLTKTSETAKANGCAFATNGGPFKEGGKGGCLGVLINNSTILSSDFSDNHTAQFGVTSNGEWFLGNLNSKEEAKSLSIINALSGFDWLVYDKKVLPMPGGKQAPRSAIGVDNIGRLVLLEVDGCEYCPIRQGPTLEQMARLLTNLGVWHAINLDGGGSSTVYSDGNVINSPTCDDKGTICERPVATITCVH